MTSLGVHSPLRQEADSREGAPLGCRARLPSRRQHLPGSPEWEARCLPGQRRRLAQSLSQKVEGSERASPACWPSGNGIGDTPQTGGLRSTAGADAGCLAGEERERRLAGPRGRGRGAVDSPGAPKSGAAATPVPQSLPGTPGRTFPSSPRLLSSEEPGAGGAGGGAAAEGTASCLKSF